jgi:antitoxin component of MazEF toxin-antitoxin module
VDFLHVGKGNRLGIEVRGQSLVVIKLVRRSALEELCSGMSEEDSNPPVLTDEFVGAECSY